MGFFLGEAQVTFTVANNAGKSIGSTRTSPRRSRTPPPPRKRSTVPWKPWDSSRPSLIAASPRGNISYSMSSCKLPPLMPTPRRRNGRLHVLRCAAPIGIYSHRGSTILKTSLPSWTATSTWPPVVAKTRMNRSSTLCALWLTLPAPPLLKSSKNSAQPNHPSLRASATFTRIKSGSTFAGQLPSSFRSLVTDGSTLLNRLWNLIK